MPKDSGPSDYLRCPVCQDVFHPTKKATRQVYCSIQCKRKAAYRRAHYETLMPVEIMSILDGFSLAIVCETCGGPLTHFVSNGNGPEGFGCAMCDFGPDTYGQPSETDTTPDNNVENEYKRLRAIERLALVDLRSASVGFGPDDEQTYHDAKERYDAAFDALYECDQRRTAHDIEAL